MSEKAFENKVKQFLKDEDCWYVKYWAGGGFTKSGIPDLLVCCEGHFMGIELKGPKGRPSELQKHNLKRIRQAGGLGILLYPKDYEFFKKMIYAMKHNGDWMSYYNLIRGNVK